MILRERASKVQMLHKRRQQTQGLLFAGVLFPVGSFFIMSLHKHGDWFDAPMIVGPAMLALGLSALVVGLTRFYRSGIAT